MSPVTIAASVRYMTASMMSLTVETTVVLVGDEVDIQAKPQFLVEALGPIDVRDRYHQNFKFHIHDQYSFTFIYLVRLFDRTEAVMFDASTGHG